MCVTKANDKNTLEKNGWSIKNIVKYSSFIVEYSSYFVVESKPDDAFAFIDFLCNVFFYFLAATILYINWI